MKHIVVIFLILVSKTTTLNQNLKTLEKPKEKPEHQSIVKIKYKNLCRKEHVKQPFSPIHADSLLLLLLLMQFPYF